MVKSNTPWNEVNKLSDNNDHKKQRLANGQAPGQQGGPGQMGTGSNGQGSGGGNGGKGGNPQGNKPSRSGARNTTTRKVSFCMDYNEEPAPAKTLKFIDKGFDLTPSPIAVSATQNISLASPEPNHELLLW